MCARSKLYPYRLDDMVDLPLLFTAAEKRVLVKDLRFCISLHVGDRTPRTHAQGHFMMVIRGEANPESIHEVLYLRFLMAKGLPRRAPAPDCRQRFQCTSCGRARTPKELLSASINQRCLACNSHTRPQAAQSGRSRTESRNESRSIFGFHYGGDKKGTGIFQSGGIADYDYDKVTPHGIPRKRRNGRG